MAEKEAAVLESEGQRDKDRNEAGASRTVSMNFTYTLMYSINRGQKDSRHH